jgi:hypothetical protein
VIRARLFERAATLGHSAAADRDLHRVIDATIRHSTEAYPMRRLKLTEACQQRFIKALSVSLPG